MREQALCSRETGAIAIPQKKSQNPIAGWGVQKLKRFGNLLDMAGDYVRIYNLSKLLSKRGGAPQDRGSASSNN